MEAKRATRTPGEAIASLVCAIVGFFTLGIILGPIAIVLARTARRKIQEDPELEGDGIATAGLVIGIIDTALWAVGIIVGIIVVLSLVVCISQVGSQVEADAEEDAGLENGEVIGISSAEQPSQADLISEHEPLMMVVRELLVDPASWMVEEIGALWRDQGSKCYWMKSFGWCE